MFYTTTIIAALYFIIILAVAGFGLSMIYRFVKAFEKIASTYEKKNNPL